jgi:myosin-1
LNSTIEEVEKSLLYRIVAARGEVMEKGHSLDDAYYGRDALCKVWQEHSNSET